MPEGKRPTQSHDRCSLASLIGLLLSPFLPTIDAITETSRIVVRREDPSDQPELNAARSTPVVPLPLPRAGVAQLAERQPSKLHVASSNLVSRSKPFRLVRGSPRQANGSKRVTTEVSRG